MSQRLQSLLIDEEMGSFGNFSPLSPSPQVSKEKNLKLAVEKADQIKKTAPKLNRDLIESRDNSEKSMTEAGDGIPMLKLKRFEFPSRLNEGGTSIPASLTNFDLVPGGTPRLVSNQLLKSQDPHARFQNPQIE